MQIPMMQCCGIISCLKSSKSYILKDSLWLAVFHSDPPVVRLLAWVRQLHDIMVNYAIHPDVGLSYTRNGRTDIEPGVIITYGNHRLFRRSTPPKQSSLPAWLECVSVLIMSVVFTSAAYQHRSLLDRVPKLC